MKYLIVLVIVLATVSSSFVLTDSRGDVALKNDAGIKFENISFEDALKKAKQENKLVFVDAYAEWCGPCKMLARTTFKSVKVGEVFNKNFINLQIDMEKGEGPALSRKYRVTAYPTLFLISPDGKVEKRMLGMMSEDQLLTHVKDFVK